MKVAVGKGDVEGRVEAPPSKSFTHRALICAALADGESRISRPLSSDDTEATREALEALGCAIRSEGRDLLVVGGGLHEPRSEIFCRESGTTLRFLTAVCSLIDGESGAECKCDGEFPPVVVRGVMRGGRAALPGAISSQFISALLLASPMADGDVEVEVLGELESRPYVMMTMETQRAFGVDVSAEGGKFFIKPKRYRGARFEIEGDWSSAAFIIALGVMAGETEVFGLRSSSSQADRAILDMIREMGGDISIRGDSIIARESSLSAIRADVSNCPDSFPILAALCAIADGRSELSGIRRLRFKESDRVAAMAEGLGRMGAKVEVLGDSFFVEGSELHPAGIDPKGDHRIAMAFAVLGARVGNVAIEGAECVAKSWPSFWGSLASLGVPLEVGS
jgi:3-phosphoshikimate 1-carboxyvinyltransferase